MFEVLLRTLNNQSHDASLATDDQSALLSNKRAKYQGSNGRQLHKNVDRGAGGVLQRVSNSVTDHRSFVLVSRVSLGVFLRELEFILPIVVKHIGIRKIDFVVALGDELLCVVPGTARVAKTESNLNTRDNYACE